MVGIFPTPVFFYVITGLGELPVFSTPRMRRVGSVLALLLKVLCLGLPTLLQPLMRRKKTR